MTSSTTGVRIKVSNARKKAGGAGSIKPQNTTTKNGGGGGGGGGSSTPKQATQAKTSNVKIENKSKEKIYNPYEAV